MAIKKCHQNQARAAMKKLGLYKTEFGPIISVYAELRAEYDLLTARYIESDYQFAETSPSGTKKAPIVTTLEALRKDILSYASQLGLTPQGLLKANDRAFAKKEKNGILSMLAELNDDAG